MIGGSLQLKSAINKGVEFNIEINNIQTLQIVA